MQSQNGPPIYPLDYDGFHISDMLGGVSTAEFSLSQQLGNDALFPLAPLQQPAHLLPTIGMDMNGMPYGRGMMASSSPHVTIRSDQNLLDVSSVPVSDREPLPSVSSRSLPEMISRESFKADHSGSRQQHLSTKEIVREQNRKAAARFRQRQKVSSTFLYDCSASILCCVMFALVFRSFNHKTLLISPYSAFCWLISPTVLQWELVFNCSFHALLCQHSALSTCFGLCQDKLREYEKQIQELTAKLSAVEKEKSTYELKCGEMEKVHTVSECCQSSCAEHNNLTYCVILMECLSIICISWQVVRQKMSTLTVHQKVTPEVPVG